MLGADSISQPIPQARASRLPAITRSDVLVTALLACVLLLGAYFRFTGQNWDDFVHFHPDERFLTGLVVKLGVVQSFTINNSIDGYKSIDEQSALCQQRYPQSNGVGGFFDAQCSIYNPHNVGEGFYAYGTVPLFIAKWASQMVAELTNDSVWISYDGAHLVWRFLSALADMGTILLVFMIGVYLYGKWTGLAAAAMYACLPFAIQQAHFGTTDAMATLFVAFTLLFAVRIQLKGQLLDYAGFGVAVAASVASRINLAPLAVLVLVPAILRIIPFFDANLPWEERKAILTYHFSGVILSGIVAFIAFRFMSPYTFMGPGILGLAPNPRFFADAATSRYQVSGDFEVPPNWQWVGRPSYLFPLWNMVLWGMGIGLGLTGWLSWLWAGWRLVRGRMGATRNLVLFAWVGGYFAFIGGIWVMSMRYYLPLYPAIALLGAWGLSEILRRAYQPAAATWQRVGAAGLATAVIGFCVLWGMMFTNIYRHQFSVVQASDWIWENVPGDFAMKVDNARTPLINIAIPAPIFGINEDAPIEQRVTRFENGQPFTTAFTALVDGTISSVHAPHLGALNDNGGPSSIRITVSPLDSDQPIATATLVAHLARDSNVLGNAYDIPFDKPLEVQKGQTYTFNVTVVDGGPVITSGEVMAWEGDWDEVVPAKTCALPPGMTLAGDPPPGMFNAHTCQGHDIWNNLLDGYKLQIVWDDNDTKRDWMANVLDHTDYIIIGTNRRYDSNSRIPSRFPMTIRYYDALFSGELGFELVAQFQETFELGPFRVSDQYLPTYTAPRWLNEFEAEEAFHVYDHPAVFIFRKTDAYTHQKMHAILYSVPLLQVNQVNGGFACPSAPGNPTCDPNMVGVVPLYGREPAQAPTQLQFTQDMRQTQYDNGTWSDRFFPNALINTQPLLTALLWWLTIMIFGWLTFPLLFVAFPGLADRGYGIAKFAGILLVAWFAWFAASLRIPLWSQGGIVLALILLALVSGLLGWQARAELLAFVREHRRRLMWIEIITLIAFLGFLFVRLTNPDLWHPGYGGEKPMDFAYFNGVLRSTIFPPIDPWFAGGYINYYYFGFVIVGVPVLLLGVVPAIAYNLILPTLFALTGIGAFSVAFSIVNAWSEKRKAAPANESWSLQQPLEASESPTRVVRMGNPWVAGIAALLLAVVLGNLDTPRVIGNGLAQMGGYEPTTGLQDWLVKEYTKTYGVAPNGDALSDIMSRAVNDNLSDRIRYEISNSAALVSSVVRGIGEVFSGKPLSIDPSRWFWGPTRVLAETPGVEGNAINEMPFFTFLYGDLHAHMIDMPVMLLIMAFVFNEFILAVSNYRSRLSSILGLAIGALAVGLARATNTWDWPSFLALSVAGLTYIWWLRWKRPEAHWDDVTRWLWVIILPLFLRIGLALVRPTDVQGNPQDSSVLDFVQTLSTVLLGLSVLFVVFKALASRKLGLGSRRSLIHYVLFVGGFVALSFLLVYPFTAWYATSYNSIQPWDQGKSPLWAYLDIHGVFLFLIFSLLVWDTARWFRSVRVRSLRGTWLLLLIGLVGIAMILLGTLIMAAKDYQVALVVIPMVLWIAALFFRPGQSRAMQYVLVLAGLALALTLFVEIYVIVGDIGRQNTVFKFYIQAWLLFSVAGGAAVAWLVQGSPDWRGWVRGSWYSIAGLLFIVALMYPIMATRGKAVYRMGTDTSPTLDGMQYMVSSQEGENGVYFPLNDDYKMIRWMQDHLQGSPTIMEGRSYPSEYRWDGRVSIYTGLPSVLGWSWHQKQQRTFPPMDQVIDRRAANIIAFYTIPDIQPAWDILRDYDVSYVVVSGLEKAYFPPEGLAKFSEMVSMGLLKVVYHDGDATLYKVNRDAGSSLALNHPPSMVSANLAVKASG
jgi:YYY domain-containing protein